MEKIRKGFKGIFGAGALAVMGAGSAMATTTVDLTGVSLNTADPVALAATILAALGTLWGIRKLVKLINRS